MTDDPLDAMKARWSYIQGFLFPWMREDNDPITEALGRLVTTLDVIGLEAFVPEPPRGPGRPPEDRRALARAFVAKAVLGVPTTSALIERLDVDKSLRRILGWERRSQVAFRSHVFPGVRRIRARRAARQIHAALIERALGRDASSGRSRATPREIEAREKPVRTRPTTAKTIIRRRIIPRRRASADVHARANSVRGRSRRALKRQVTQNLSQMLADLPSAPATSVCKKNSKGYKETLDRVQTRTSTWPAAKSQSPAC